MKTSLILLLSIVLATVACTTRRSSKTTKPTYTDTVANKLDNVPKPLETTLSMADTISFGSPINLKFTVRNPADSMQKFCKWHTPFEPFLNNYLAITDGKGKAVKYKGAMAKRVMPPPAETYLEIAPKDSLSTTVDLTKGYAFETPGTYHIIYQGQNMSGLKVANDLTFILLR